MTRDCRVEGCKNQTMLERYFCSKHHDWWLASPERARAVQVDIAAHTLSMLADFARRTYLEGQERK